MLKKSGYLLLMLALFPALSIAQNGLEVIQQRMVLELMKSKVDEDRIANLIHTLREDGSWPDINYEDVSRTGFEHSVHLRNMVDLSRAFKKENAKFLGNQELKATIFAALNFWLNNDFICDNWWWNQIGTTNALVNVLLIMDDDLSHEQKTKAAPIIGRAHLNASGARPSGDRIKIAGILAKHLLVQVWQSQEIRLLRL